MQIRVTARRFDLSEEIKSFALDEAARLEKFYDGIIDGDVVLGWQKKDRLAEINIKVYGKMLTAHARTEEMHKSIVEAVDKLERQLRKYKEKMQDFSHETIRNRAESMEE